MRARDSSNMPAHFLRTAGHGMLAGSVLALYGAGSPGVAALIAALICAVLARGHHVGALGGFALGLILSGAAARDARMRHWPEELDGTRVVARVNIDSVPVVDADGLRFDARLEVEAPASFAGRALQARLVRPHASTQPHAGESWRMLLQLNSMPSQRGGHPPLDAHGRVLGSKLESRLAPAGPGLIRLRERLANAIRDRVVDRDAAALITALAVGVTGQVSDEQWRVFALTGTTHLVAISGLHVTLLAVWAMAGVRRLWRLGVGWLHCDRDGLAAVVGGAVALGYSALAGMSIPTLRTLLMFTVWWLARAAARVVDAPQILSLALLGVLALDPFAPLSAGFWLSFVAVAVLILGDNGAVAGGHSPALALLRSQWRVGLAVLPLTLAWFERGALLGSLANLLAIPLFSFLLLPCVLVATLLLCFDVALARWPLDWAAAVYAHGWPWLAGASDWPGAAVAMRASPSALLLLCAAAAAMLLPAPRAVRALAGMWIALALWPTTLSDRAGEFRALVLDAGEGLAVLVATAHHTIVVGTGEVYGGDGTRAARVIGSALRDFGRQRIDLLVLPRGTAAELAGAAALARQWPVVTMRVGDDAQLPGGCAAPAAWQFDGTRVEITPLPSGRAGRLQCAARFAGPGGTLLVLGRPPDQADMAAAASAPPQPAGVVVVQGGAALGRAAAFWARHLGPQSVVGIGRVLKTRRAELASRWGVAAVAAVSPEGCKVVQFTFSADSAPQRAWRADPSCG